ncbi:hypothetical protein V7S43_014931 [Phytophthora oleae]|uniref:Uncharacterized protein n=1 Tax=Phytophthora oleae TaxID=2107226 RepID=A0ABD3F0F9_9STRA
MSKSTYEQLVQQTVRSVLFRGDTKEKQADSKTFDTEAIVNDTETKDKATSGIPKDSLLRRLIGSSNENSEEPALDEDNNGAGAECSWVMDCATWSLEQLRREKTTIKRYLNAQQLPHNCQEAPAGNLLLFEAYALIKLFLLERDLDYRQCLQQSIGCDTTFLTLIHVLLSLYARYFERVHGRQVR